MYYEHMNNFYMRKIERLSGASKEFIELVAFFFILCVDCNDTQIWTKNRSCVLKVVVMTSPAGGKTQTQVTAVIDKWYCVYIVRVRVRVCSGGHRLHSTSIYNIPTYTYTRVFHIIRARPQ